MPFSMENILELVAGRGPTFGLRKKEYLRQVDSSQFAPQAEPEFTVQAEPSSGSRPLTRASSGDSWGIFSDHASTVTSAAGKSGASAHPAIDLTMPNLNDPLENINPRTKTFKHVTFEDNSRKNSTARSIYTRKDSHVDIATLSVEEPSRIPLPDNSNQAADPKYILGVGKYALPEHASDDFIVEKLKEELRYQPLYNTHKMDDIIGEHPYLIQRPHLRPRLEQSIKAHHKRLHPAFAVLEEYRYSNVGLDANPTTKRFAWNLGSEDSAGAPPQNPVHTPRAPWSGQRLVAFVPDEIASIGGMGLDKLVTQCDFKDVYMSALVAKLGMKDLLDEPLARKRGAPRNPNVPQDQVQMDDNEVAARRQAAAARRRIMIVEEAQAENAIASDSEDDEEDKEDEAEEAEFVRKQQEMQAKKLQKAAAAKQTLVGQVCAGVTQAATSFRQALNFMQPSGTQKLAVEDLQPAAPKLEPASLKSAVSFVDIGQIQSSGSATPITITPKSIGIKPAAPSMKLSVVDIGPAYNISPDYHSNYLYANTPQSKDDVAAERRDSALDNVVTRTPPIDIPMGKRVEDLRFGPLAPVEVVRERAQAPMMERIPTTRRGNRVPSMVPRAQRQTTMVV